MTEWTLMYRNEWPSSLIKASWLWSGPIVQLLTYLNKGIVGVEWVNCTAADTSHGFYPAENASFCYSFQLLWQTNIHPIIDSFFMELLFLYNELSS